VILVRFSATVPLEVGRIEKPHVRLAIERHFDDIASVEMQVVLEEIHPFRSSLRVTRTTESRANVSFCQAAAMRVQVRESPSAALH
jgi:hypothetical protein